MPFFRLFLVVLLLPATLQAKLPTNIYGEKKSNYTQFWFLYEKEIRDGQEEIIFRPFFSSYKEKISNFQFTTFLYPVFTRESTNHWHKSTFLFFFGNESMKHVDSGWDTDVISPIFQWGIGDTQRERYFSFFPFFGSIRNKLSWSEIRYFMFFLYVRWEHKDFRAHSILWPLTIFGSSETRREYRILPFFSIKEHLGKFRHYSVLWPFIQWGEDNLDKKEPTSYKFVFPFFNYKSSEYGNMRSYAFLWFPLIGSLFGYGYDKRTNQFDMNILFFFFQYGYSNEKDYRKHIFIPFYGYSRYAGKEARFITPFFLHLRTDTYLIKSDYYFFIPFYMQMHQYFVKEARTDVYYKVWPFFKYHKDTEGNLSWNVLSLFPLRSTTIEKNWEPIWSIIEYKRFINGERRFSLFMRLYTQRWTEDSLYIHIPLLLDLAFEPDRTRVKILHGLIGYEREYEKRTLQILWFIKV